MAVVCLCLAACVYQFTSLQVRLLCTIDSSCLCRLYAIVKLLLIVVIFCTYLIQFYVPLTFLEPPVERYFGRPYVSYILRAVIVLITCKPLACTFLSIVAAKSVLLIRCIGHCNPRSGRFHFSCGVSWREYPFIHISNCGISTDISTTGV